MSQLRAGPAETSVTAELPPDVSVQSPDSALDCSPGTRWIGVWRGWACRAAQCDVKLAVERWSGNTATVVYAGANTTQRISERAEAQLIDNGLEMKLRTGATLRLRLRDDGDMDLSLWGNATQPISVGVLTRKPFAYVTHCATAARTSMPSSPQAARDAS